MFVIWKSTGVLRVIIAEVDTEDDAIDFCETYNWELKDENGFVWDLDYTES